MSERVTSHGGGRGGAGGFTLVELLVVIGIIIVLVGILLPVLGDVRKRAQAADTLGQIQGIAAQIDAYYADFNAYPGPLSYADIAQHIPGGATAKPDIDVYPGSQPWDTTYDQSYITMSENLVLGLLGGLKRVSATDIQYNTEWVGGGPGWLGATPKKLPSYGDAVNLSLGLNPSNLPYGDYFDSGGVTGQDTIIPEYLDKFPDALPLLYLRARPGLRAAAAMATAENNPLVTGGAASTRNGQYDLSQIHGYVYADDDGKTIGVGRELRDDEYVGCPPRGQVSGIGTHGLQTVNLMMTTDVLTGNSRYPYDLYPALKHQTIPNTPKQKDRYILISAGPDRVYGTKDDVTNFGSY